MLADFWGVAPVFHVHHVFTVTTESFFVEPPSPASLPARLTRSGSSIQDPEGKPIVLRGMNEGTWGEMRSQDAANIAAQGAGVVRGLIRWWGKYGRAGIDSHSDAAAGHFDPDHLAQFLREVQWCIDAGLWVIPVIDSDCGQSGMQDAGTITYCSAQHAVEGEYNFWTDPPMRQFFKEAWIHLAGILKTYPQIAFYELLPEPLADRDSSYAPAVSAFYQELMVAIEEVARDTRTPFLVGARDAYNITLCDEAYMPEPRWANRVVYIGNLFIRTHFKQQENIDILESRLAALVAMKTTRNVPVFIQQFGVRTGDDPTGFYLEAGLSRMHAAGIGYAGWQWRQNSSNMQEYAIIVIDAVTGEERIKTDVLALYAKYWQA